MRVVGKRSTGEKAFAVLNALIMLFMIVICLYPMLYVLFASVSEPARLTGHQGLMFKPLGFTLRGYRMVLENPGIVSGYINTVFYVAVGTLFNIVMTSLGAFVLSRKSFYFKNMMMFGIVFTMFFSGGLIPSYLVIQKLGLIDTRWALIIPGVISTYNLIVMRTSFLEIPDSLEESAKIDGANELTILCRIVLPLSKALIAVMVLFYGVAHWNSWFNAMLYLRNRDLYPLQLILREILLINASDNMTAEAGIGQGDISAYKILIQYATIVVATLPVLLLYPFIQKYFTKGVMIGAVKG